MRSFFFGLCLLLAFASFLSDWFADSLPISFVIKDRYTARCQSSNFDSECLGLRRCPLPAHFAERRTWRRNAVDIDEAESYVNDESGDGWNARSPLYERFLQQNDGTALPPLRVLYEDDRMLAVDKPSGITHHDSPADGRPGLLSLFRLYQRMEPERRRTLLPGTDYSGRIYGTHRLDRVTSGALLLAKDGESAGLLARTFRERRAKKYYCALSCRRAKKKQGRVRGDMAKARRGAWKLTRGAEDPAVTEFWTAGVGHIEVGMGSEAMARTFVLFRPYTGRTHQLRCAAKAIGLPILGDTLYGGSKLEDGSDREGIYLHSTALCIDLVEAGLEKEGGDHPQLVTIFSPPPFEHLWDFGSIGNPCMPILTRLFEKGGENKALLQKLLA